MPIFVAMLRGVNVGGKHRLPMAELRAVASELGWEQPETYIQSGNLVFSTEEPHRDLSARLAAAIGARMGFAVPVVVVAGDVLAEIGRENPYLASCAPSALHVTFLSAEPASRRVSTLDSSRSPGDQFQVCGAAVYLHCPSGIRDTRLTVDWFERQLGGTATCRNWNTVLALANLVGARQTAAGKR